MMTLSLYSVLVFVHVASAMVLVGHSLGAPLVQVMMREARTLPALRAWLEFARRSARWNPPAALVLLFSGVYLGASTGWWRQGWFLVALAAWIVNAALAARVLKPAAAALGQAAALAGDGPVPDSLDRLRNGARWSAARVMLANDLVILYVMIDKPSTAGCVLLVGLAQLSLAAVALARKHPALTVPGAGQAPPAQDPGPRTQAPRLTAHRAAP